MKKTLMAGLLALLFHSPLHAQSPAPIKVACVGNSVTYGYGIADRKNDSYPAQLQKMLGRTYDVRNFGHSGATLCRKAYRPYDRLPEFHQALDFKADRVVIHLGLNDTDPRSWPNYADDFIADYQALIDSFRTANPDVKVWICRMTPIFHTHPRFQSGTRDWHSQIQKKIEQIARTYHVGLIDLYTPLHCRPELFPDALHPNPEGAGILARQVYGALTGDFGGLQLAPNLGDNMVLQREKPIVISGTANAGEEISVRFNRSKRKTTVRHDGHWSVAFPAQQAGGPYTLTVSGNQDCRQLHNIWVGEVWLCSGQSNMAFQVNQTTTARQDLKNAASQSRLHLFNMRNLVPTNATEWAPALLDSINRLHYVLPGTWETCNAANAATFSAVAYHFGSLLADSLDCHVGLVCNAVGGATTESWIDRTTLEHEYPAILYDWLNNDHIQDWARGRAALNIRQKRQPMQRHPYEPCYLFESGIQPLKDLSFRGVIWYQGESNAHNVELHEKLFCLLQRSWRNFWKEPQLPFHFVQLSGIGTRPSWPLFRDSQRRLAQSQKDTWMTVSADWGDSLDVHPKNKLPIGQRLALSALHHTYRHAVLPSGPEFKEAVYKGNKVFLTFQYGEGLHAADGKDITGFEVAGADGVYHQATARKTARGLTVSSPDVARPCAVRYAWQPFTRANLVNSGDMPCSTFRDENF